MRKDAINEQPQIPRIRRHAMLNRAASGRYGGTSASDCKRFRGGEEGEQDELAGRHLELPPLDVGNLDRSCRRDPSSCCL
jgi:hypothetical protein